MPYQKPKSEPTLSTLGPSVGRPDAPDVIGGVQFLELIGRGGFGAVYRATDDRLGRVVAAKVLLDENAGRDRFIAEAMVTGNLQHPHIIPVHSLQVDGRGRTFFTMPVVRGNSLDEVIQGLRKGEPAIVAEYTLPRLVSILVAICDAVAYAHSRGVVHRDLKPQNIMLGRFGEVFVLDWGIVKLTGEAAPQAPKHSLNSGPAADAVKANRPLDADVAHTLPGTIIGIPGYMAPEQARGDSDLVGFPADVYSLGVILFQMLTLRMPVDNSTVQKALTQTLEGRIPDARIVAGGRQVPPALASIAAKAMALDPAGRYPTAAALVTDLRAWLEDRAVAARPDALVERGMRWLRHHRVAAALISGTVITLTLAALVGLTLNSAYQADRVRLAEKERVAAQRLAEFEREGRLKLERRATATRAYLPGLDKLQRAEWNAVWVPRALAAFDRALEIDPDLN